MQIKTSLLQEALGELQRLMDKKEKNRLPADGGGGRLELISTPWI